MLTKYGAKQLSDARKYAASYERTCARECMRVDYGFADHVTHAKKLEYRDAMLKEAESIERGEQDHNLTIQQSMHYFLTGECIPLLK